jgi:hypothetical protein
MSSVVMKRSVLYRTWVLCLPLTALGGPPSAVTAVPVPGDPLTGNGDIRRTLLTYDQLFSNAAPTSPVDDSGGFGLPANAAPPTQTFEGTLTLTDPTGGGRSRILRNDFRHDTSSGSPWVHLASFSFQFVQNGSHLIPVQQGLVITGSPAWNYIVGPGRVWRENGDKGYMRASFPFALVERNQNCVHNGEMTFLFNSAMSPNISKVRYQVTQETCMNFKLDMWGQVSATYSPGTIANGRAIENAHASEVVGRLPTKPFAALERDYPHCGIDLEKFTQRFKSPADITAYGLFINGVNYVSGCQTRYGAYAFCEKMRLPSYSLAKSSFAGLALMWLGQKYGPGVYGQLVREFVPEYVRGGDWSSVTFNNVSDMATGNYISAGYEVDENSRQESAFLTAESYSAKIVDAFAPFPHKAAPGTRWVYQSHASFILTQAMNAYLERQQGSGADLFDAIRDHVFKPIHVSQGGLTTLRTGNSATGKPFGSHGLFFTQDDIAKIGDLLNNSGGVINGTQVLDPVRLRESLFRTADPAKLGVAVPDLGKPAVPHTWRYHNQFWAKYMTAAEFPQYRCNFWVPHMSGYGGNTVLLLPNGAVYYIFSDGGEFVWYPAANEINRISPLCH